MLSECRKQSNKSRGYKHFLRRAVLSIVLGSLFSAYLLGQTTRQDQSIAPQSAAQIDEAWQKASAKYDKPRNALLATVERESTRGPFQPTGSRWRSTGPRTGTGMRSLASSFIGFCTPYLRLEVSGTRARCIWKDLRSINIMWLRTDPLTKFGYKDFIPMFKAEHFDPQAWAKLFKDSGARYVVPVFEHHDGFAMYDSDLSDWTVKKMGSHRDLDGEIATAVRAEGLHLGASSHRIEHDWFLDGGRKQNSDVNDPQYAAFYGPAHPGWAMMAHRWRRTGLMYPQRMRKIGWREMRRLCRNITPT
jgi:alpha-L-fucosidase